MDKGIINNIELVVPDFKSFKEKPKLNLAIEVLERELERQNLLIKTHENILDKNLDPLPDTLTLPMYQLRDQIKEAINYLKTKGSR